ncbi:MAG: hypothetical protein IT307_11580, partial [Chloroflexi bacterium]|nr:hypothetical protein [Chloroflexota bacterium]
MALALQGAFPPEKVVPLRPGPLAFGAPAELRPSIDFSGSETKGPGVLVRLEAPSEPSMELELRLQGVGGRQGVQDRGKRVFTIPAANSASTLPGAPAWSDAAGALFGSLFAPTADVTSTPAPTSQPTASPTPQAQAAATPVLTATTTAVTTTTTSTTSIVTTTSTTITSATSTSTTGTTATSTTTAVTTSTTTSLTTGTPTAPTTPTATPTAPPGTVTPGGNRYGAAIDLTYQPSADGLTVKETLVFRDRPRTNVLAYQLDARGLAVSPQPDGSLHLFDHAGRHVFTVLAPTFQDGRGQRGTASYTLVDNQLQVVLDQRLIATGVLPLEVDPTIQTILTSTDLLGTTLPLQPAPWQRTAVVAQDGTRASFAYDPSAGIKFWTSTDDYATTPTATIISGTGSTPGGSGFSVEIDSNTDTICLAVAGASGGSNVLYLYVLTYSSSTRTWTVPTSPVNVVTASSSLSWSGVSVVLERTADEAADDYVWVGADERSSSNTYTYKAWVATLSSSGTLGSFGTAPSGLALTSSATSYVHYGALVAITGGVAAVGRGLVGSSQRQAAQVYTRASNAWGSVAAVVGGNPAFGNGREFSLLAVADPLVDTYDTMVPLVAMSVANNDDGSQDPIRVYVLRADTTVWKELNGGPNASRLASAKTDSRPQLVWDGTSFYLFRLKNNGTSSSSTNWQINGQRGRLFNPPSGQTQNAELEGDNTWVVESSGNTNLRWLSLPRLLTAPLVPFYYVRKDVRSTTTDELTVQVKRLELLGERSAWRY